MDPGNSIMISEVRWVNMTQFSSVARTARGAPPSFWRASSGRRVRVGTLHLTAHEFFLERIRVDGAPLRHEEIVHLTDEIVPLVESVWGIIL